MRITKVELPGNLAQEYHLQSNNSPWMLKNPAIKQANYDQKIVALVNEGPRQIDKGNQSGIKLLSDSSPLEMTLEQALLSRVSSRSYSSTPISFQKFSKLKRMVSAKMTR